MVNPSGASDRGSARSPELGSPLDSAVDVHGHAMPDKLLRALNAGDLAIDGVGVRADGDGYKMRFANGPWSRTVPAGLWDRSMRSTWMHERGIAHQVVSPWTDALGYQLPTRLGRDWSARLNEALLEQFHDEPGVSVLGTVALQNPRTAAPDLATVAQLGMPGITIGTRINGRELDDPQLTEFWVAANELQMVVFLHPEYDTRPRYRPYGLANGLVRGLDTADALARLLYSGIPARYPAAKIIAPHGGGALPYLLGRVVSNWRTAQTPWDPRDSFARLYFDSIVFDARALSFLLELTDADQVMLGSDYPFPAGDLDPRRVVAESSADAHQAQVILSGVASRVFGARADGPSLVAP